MNDSNQEKAKKFEEMDMFERAVAVANDVIARLDAHKLTARMYNGYVEPKDVIEITDESMDQCISSEDIEKLQNGCNVCALGALFISRVDLFNQITWSGIIHLSAPIQVYENQISADIMSQNRSKIFFQMKR
jgi:hypothetical protein